MVASNRVFTIGKLHPHIECIDDGNYLFDAASNQNKRIVFAIEHENPGRAGRFDVVDDGKKFIPIEEIPLLHLAVYYHQRSVASNEIEGDMKLFGDAGREVVTPAADKDDPSAVFGKTFQKLDVLFVIFEFDFSISISKPFLL